MIALPSRSYKSVSSQLRRVSRPQLFSQVFLIKNIALSYTVPQSWLKKCGASSAQVYAQVLNPFLFGGELVKAGINPDDLTGWDAGNHIGGQTNNTCITRSLVLGVRLGF